MFSLYFIILDFGIYVLLTNDFPTQDYKNMSFQFLQILLQFFLFFFFTFSALTHLQVIWGV